MVYDLMYTGFFGVPKTFYLPCYTLVIHTLGTIGLGENGRCHVLNVCPTIPLHPFVPSAYPDIPPLFFRKSTIFSV